jgi:oxygen-independent coproporphyrinogen-3 oxidase
VQNVDTWEQYVALLERGELPLGRALPVTPRQRLIREMLLQLKTGRLEPAYFRAKFGTDIVHEFAEGFDRLQEGGYLSAGPDQIELTRPGLLQVDRLLPAFFEPQHHTTRYT